MRGFRDRHREKAPARTPAKSAEKRDRNVLEFLVPSSSDGDDLSIKKLFQFISKIVSPSKAFTDRRWYSIIHIFFSLRCWFIHRTLVASDATLLFSIKEPVLYFCVLISIYIYFFQIGLFVVSNFIRFLSASLRLAIFH